MHRRDRIEKWLIYQHLLRSSTSQTSRPDGAGRLRAQQSRTQHSVKVIAEYADFTSTVYAPLRREGHIPDTKTARIEVSAPSAVCWLHKNVPNVGKCLLIIWQTFACVGTKSFYQLFFLQLLVVEFTEFGKF